MIKKTRIRIPPPFKVSLSNISIELKKAIYEKEAESVVSVEPDYFKTSAIIDLGYKEALGTKKPYKEILNNFINLNEENNFKTYLGETKSSEEREKKLKEYGKFLHKYGDVLRMSNRYDQAIENLRTAEKVFKWCGAEEWRACVIAKLAQTLTNKGDWRRAIEWIKCGLKNLQRASGIDKDMKKRVEGELYKVCTQAQLLKCGYEPYKDDILLEALQYNKIAEKNFEQLDLSYPVGHCWWDTARIYRLQGKISEANGKINEIDETFGENRYGFQIWMVDDEIEILREEANYDPFKLNKAKKIVKESLNKRKKIGNQDRIADSYTIIGVIDGLLEHKYRAYMNFCMAYAINKRIKSEFGQKIVTDYYMLIKSKKQRHISQINFI